MAVNEEISKRLTADGDPSDAFILWPASQAKASNSATDITPRMGLEIETRLAGPGGGFIGSRDWIAWIGVPNVTRAYRAGQWCTGAIVITLETETVGIVSFLDTNANRASETIAGYARMRCYMFNTFTQKAKYNENPELISVCTGTFPGDPNAEGVFWTAGEFGTPHQLLVYLETPWFNISAYPLNYLHLQQQTTPSIITWNATNLSQPAVARSWLSGSVFNTSPPSLTDDIRKTNGPERIYFQQTADFPWPANDLPQYRQVRLTSQELRGYPSRLLGSSPDGSFTRIEFYSGKNENNVQETVDEPISNAASFSLPFPGPPP